ncbi:MAG TPA: hypothetical protein VFT75_15410 [Nocardioidaceae bacterium]|jgi:hypothetical protein|nr:hypothetical protein [Nocardioidaceae bacterium]
METMTNDRQQAALGMPASGRAWMSTVPAMGLPAGATAGLARLGVDVTAAVQGTTVSGHGYDCSIVFAKGAFPGQPAWSPPI